MLQVYPRHQEAGSLKTREPKSVFSRRVGDGGKRHRIESSRKVGGLGFESNQKRHHKKGKREKARVISHQKGGSALPLPAKGTEKLLENAVQKTKIQVDDNQKKPGLKNGTEERKGMRLVQLPRKQGGLAQIQLKTEDW